MNRDTKNIEAYLNNITKDENQFSVPENYFNSLEDSVLSKVIEEQLPGELTYNVPDDYFENFEETLFSNSEFSKKEVRVIHLKSRILKMIPTAAAACILLFVGFNYFSVTDKNKFDVISSDDLELWVDENYNNYTTTNNIEFVDTDFIESNILEDDTSLNNEDIFEYLNTIDSSSLLTEIES
jgi:hypothetical protein